MPKITCTIRLSHNPHNFEFIPAPLRERDILPVVSFWTRNKRGRKISISGFRVNDKCVFYPLWPKDGHTRYEISTADYQRIALAAVVENGPAYLSPVKEEFVNRFADIARQYVASLVA
jgi:hypothetical protein